MLNQSTNTLDKILTSIDRMRLFVASEQPKAYRKNPAEGTPEGDLTDAERSHAAALMRVNHAGEVAAQGLYEGQSVFARNDSIKEQMIEAANEELDHLNWCRERIEELNERPSKLGPIWYSGSLVIGSLAGFIGDKWSLGFIEETERQVSNHLDKHMKLLPKQDQRSRKIVAQMRLEEEQHQANAKKAGAEKLPKFIRYLMKITSKVMTKTAYHI
ncbi:2-polyprenyl-3-methyl-6-methoxy-1,4-benzoquinone monooxygenase [Woeseiaceae bacterium]|nr:2-polyprenyl-3-methyl-6-methoxy-1,4-benzoquinone monooxygenase [Woeseiaceae bacterium]